jgi:hypothetical protein
MNKYLNRDPKGSDLTMVRLIKGRMGKIKKWASLKAQVEVNLLL